MSNYSATEGQSKTFSTRIAIISSVVLLPLCPLTILAIVFTKKAKSLYNQGSFELSDAYLKKAKRYLFSAWAIALIVLFALLGIYSISRLSLI